MKKTRTRLNLMLALCMILAMLPVTAMAAEGILWGDANNDGYVNNIDAMLILQYSVGLKEESDLVYDVCDVSNDSHVNNIDAMQILQYAVGLIDKFPAEGTAVTYTVTFKDYDGRVLKTQQVNEGESAQAPAEPVRDGYVFAGWDKAFSNVTGDITVTATYTPMSTETHMVTFVDYDGTVLAIQTVNSGMDAVLPAEPSKSGADFLGWSGYYANVTKDETVRAVYSDEKNVIIVHSVSAAAGETVTVLVEIAGEVKTCGFDFSMFYDPKLEIVSYDNDLDLDVVFNSAAYENGVALNFSSTADKTRQRDIVEITFKVHDSARGVLPIMLTMTSIKELDGYNIIDAEYVLVNGAVAVK